MGIDSPLAPFLTLDSPAQRLPSRAFSIVFLPLFRKIDFHRAFSLASLSLLFLGFIFSKHTSSLFNPSFSSYIAFSRQPFSLFSLSAETLPLSIPLLLSLSPFRISHIAPNPCPETFPTDP